MRTSTHLIRMRSGLHQPACGFRFAFLAALLLLGTIGCATTSSVTSSGPQKRAKLVRTQAGDQVTLRWDTLPGVEYSVIYSRTLDRAQKWVVVPGYDHIPGNGTTTTVHFTAPERGQLYYRLSERHRP